MSLKRLCLRQHLQDGMYGTFRIKKKYIQMSLDDTELDHYIYSLDSSSDANGRFEVSGDKAEVSNRKCLAILHTENGFVRLEALAPNIYVQSLGYGFNSHSTHAGILLKHSTSSTTQSFLQLRPGEGFYIGKATFDLVPEEHSDLPFTSSGPSAAHYDTQASQMNQASLQAISPSGRGSCAVLESPHTENHQPNPILKSITETAMTGKGDSQDWPGSPSKRSLLGTIRDASKDINLEPSEGLQLPQPNDQLKISPPEESHPYPAKKRHQPSDKTGGHGLQELAMHDAHQHDLPPDGAEHDSEDGSATSPAHVLAIGEHEDASRPPADHPSPSESIPCITPDGKKSVQSSKKQKISSTQADTSQDSLIGTICVAPHASDSSIEVSKSRANSRSSSTHQEALEARPHCVEPNSSMHSTRSAVREDLSHLNVRDNSIRILFASSTAVGDSKQLMKFLSQRGVKKVQSIQSCTVLCVGKGELKKTSKLIMAVMLGKEVITEDWVTESARLGELQSIEPYVARDPERESNWGFNLRDAIERGRQGLRILQDWTIIFTVSAKKEVGKNGFSDLKEITTFAGAKNVSSALPEKSPEELPLTLIIGTDADADSPALEKWKCFTRDIISLSVLRGNLDMDSDEFLIQKSEQPKGSRKRKR